MLPGERGGEERAGAERRVRAGRVGGGRPIRYDFIAERGTELREGKGWSWECLERKRKAWEEKRVEW